MTPVKTKKRGLVFRALPALMLCMASPALAQVVIPENGIRIDQPDADFQPLNDEVFASARLWVHNGIERFAIVILDKQDPENPYSGMEWEQRAPDPIVSQDANISEYSQGEGWMIAEGEIVGNRFLQRSIIEDGCPIIATLIVEFPPEEEALAREVFTNLAESLSLAPSPICP